MKLAKLEVWIAVFSGVALACAVIYVSTPRYTNIAELEARLASRDPNPGLLVELPRQNSKGRTLLVLLGSCSSCTTQSAGLTKLDAGRWGEVVLATTGTAVDGSLKGLAAQARLITLDVELHSRLNAFFTPRLAVIDTTGRLESLQKQGQDIPQFLREVGG